MMAGGSGGGRQFRSFGYGNEVLGLPDAVFVLLRDLIAARTGVLFDEPKRQLLADKLTELVTANGLTSFLDYYYLLRYDDNSAAHWSALMDKLAVPETYFWRQPEQIEACARVVAPSHFEKNGNVPLRIWSAACCTGEEPISIAIALAEAGLLGNRPIEIVGTDGSMAMVERAMTGSYGLRSFRQLPAGLKEKYFEPAGVDRWRPVARIRSSVRWGVVNLTLPAELDSYAHADVIFCRNVFIYFSDAAIRGVVRAFSERMPKNGYLFLAASESLTRLSFEFELTEIGGAFAYTKSGSGLSSLSKETAR